MREVVPHNIGTATRCRIGGRPEQGGFLRVGS
jgi:hypothetical protein